MFSTTLLNALAVSAQSASWIKPEYVPWWLHTTWLP